jgi:hypothetical protein
MKHLHFAEDNLDIVPHHHPVFADMMRIVGKKKRMDRRMGLGNAVHLLVDVALAVKNSNNLP